MEFVKIYRMRFLILIGLILSILGVNNVFSQQVNDTIYGLVVKSPVEIVDADFKAKYLRMVAKMRRIYPMALHAKSLFDTYEKDIRELDKKKQIKKYGKSAQDKLVEDFEYLIKDMYISDGKLLVKLIHRETGITLYEILKKYRGGLQATWYQGVGKLFEQDLKSTYNPDKEDWLTERIVKEIKSGKHKLIPFNPLSKEQFKAKKKKQKERRKKAIQAKKEREKAKKKS